MNPCADDLFWHVAQIQFSALPALSPRPCAGYRCGRVQFYPPAAAIPPVCYLFAGQIVNIFRQGPIYISTMFAFITIFHETGLIGTKTAADVPCLILASGLCFRFSSKTPIITLRCRRRNICLPCASAFRGFRFQFFRRRPVRGADRRNASVMRMQSIACRISSLVESRQGRLLQYDAGEIE